MSAERLMQCMEVWGGNRAVDNGVVMPGIDAWVFSQPYEGHEAGGDVHYVSTCATGRVTRVLVADVSGHGSKAASTADGLRSLMRRYVNYIDQTRFVSRMNEAFADASVDGRFATAVVGTFWAPTATLTVSNAGHPRPMIYRAKERAWSVLRPEDHEGSEGPLNLPLGVDRPTVYDQVQIRMKRGDLVLFYSDSLIETSDTDGQLLGEDGLREVLSRIDVSAPDQVIRSLLGALEARGIGGAWRDDVTALLIRRNEMELRMGLADSMRNVGRLAGRAARRAMGEDEPVGWPEFRWSTIGGAIWRRSKKAPE